MQKLSVNIDLFCDNPGGNLDCLLDSNVHGDGSAYNYKRCVELGSENDDSGWVLKLELEELIYVKAVAFNTRNDNESGSIFA